MHSCETLPAPPATGPNLLLQLGKLIIRARSTSPAARAPPATHDRLLHAKLLAAKPSTSQQVHVQPKPETEQPKTGVEAQLNNHVNALWNEHIPICIEVLLAPECAECFSSLSRVEEDASYDRQHAQQRALLLERWTMRALVTKSHETPAFITSQWLLNAVRSQLHFSQLSAWLARLKQTAQSDEDPSERRRKLSRETCNYKKLEANCDEKDLTDDHQRKLNVVYSIKIPGESYKMAEFNKPPINHTFPTTDIGSNVFLSVTLESLPRIEDIPTVKCTCQSKRRPSKEMTPNIHEELVGKFNDLTLGPKFEMGAINSNIGNSNRRLSIISNPGSTEYIYSNAPDKEKVLDDRMLTPCSENGKHKCNCDDESDGKEQRASNPKKLDERRLKEIAKYKRRLRKECKMRKLCDSTSSEGDGLQKKESPTSIPILQASRFDRFRAIGCYRNQTYLTLPATRIETKSPFLETDTFQPVEVKRTNTIATQTDDLTCSCGNVVKIKCNGCSDRGMVRSEANYDLAAVDIKENGARRKCGDDEKSLKKHKCDNSSNSRKCDIDLVKLDSIIKRPKLRRSFPIVERIDKVVADRSSRNENDMEVLNLKEDDTVFSVPKESKRQKTYSIGEDYVAYEKCDYGTFDRCDVDSPKEEESGFQFPDPKSGQDKVPSPTEVDRFRYRFDSAASMVFHTKTGLPLTSSPAPLRRGNNCFDYDDSINGISGIKSALFHPISLSSTAVPASPTSPASPVPTPKSSPNPPPKKDQAKPKLRMGPSTGLLGSFEESALKGRLEPVATVHGFTAELGASGSFCPPHKRLPVTVFFYAPGGTNAPYMGHISLGRCGYRVGRAGTVQVSLLNPHGTLVKMFVVLYDLRAMPPAATTFLRQRTLHLPATSAHPTSAPTAHLHKWLRYLIHLRFMTSKSGKLYLHTDIRILVSRKADVDTATAHSAIARPLSKQEDGSETARNDQNTTARGPNRVFGGCSNGTDVPEIGCDNQNGVSYELRSFTYAPDNPKYSPR